MKQKLSVDEVVALLASMEDAHGVAFLLDSFGVRGDRYTCTSCPVAHFLALATGGKAVDVGHLRCAVDFTVRDIPTNVTRFTRSFDRGEWPELEA